MSSEKYEIAQDELENLFERIESTLSGGLSKRSVSGEERRHLVSRTRTQINEARAIIDEMEQEARSAPMQYRGDMMSRVRQYREEVSKLTSTLRQKADVSSHAVSLYDDTPQDIKQLTADDIYRKKVLEGTAVLESTSDSIYRSQQVAAETEAVGEEIITDLSIQRDTLERTRSRLQETNAELSTSKKLIRRLYFGIIKNKLCLILVILVELAVIAGLIYWKFFSHKGASPTPPPPTPPNTTTTIPPY